MSSNIIDGTAIAANIRHELAIAVEVFRKSTEVPPALAVVLVGEDAASAVYVRNKERACEQAGIATETFTLPDTTSEDSLLSLIEKLNDDTSFHGILVQLPLPAHINSNVVIAQLNPAKDVDGLHPVNQGRLVLGQAGLRPCTPLAVMHLINNSSARLEGKRAVVVGRSNLVGKPLALLLLERNATVTTCHSHTDDLAEQIAQADIVVAAIGSANVIKGEWIKKGAIVIDVGISRIPDGGLTGDVDFEKAKRRAGYISPVPGGVGPLTVAMLLANTVDAAEKLLSDVA